MAVAQRSPRSTGHDDDGVWQPVLVPVINHAGSFVVTPVFDASTANREGTALELHALRFIRCEVKLV